MCDLRYEVDARLFIPAIDNASPISSKTAWIEGITGIVDQDAHLPVLVGEQRNKKISKIVGTGRKHSCQRQLPMMDLADRVPVAENLADLWAHCLPHDRSAKARQITSEDRIDAYSQIDETNACIDSGFPGCAIFTSQSNFFSDHM